MNEKTGESDETWQIEVTTGQSYESQNKQRANNRKPKDPKNTLVQVRGQDQRFKKARQTVRIFEIMGRV